MPMYISVYISHTLHTNFLLACAVSGICNTHNGPCVGDGVKRLVSMVHAQQQAWSERLAARHSLLHQMTSQLQQTQYPQPHTTPPERDTDVPSVPPPPLSPSHSLSPSPEPVVTAEPPSLSIYSLSSRYSSEGWAYNVQTMDTYSSIHCRHDLHVLSDRDVSDRDVSASGVEGSKVHSTAMSRSDNWLCKFHGTHTWYVSCITDLQSVRHGLNHPFLLVCLRIISLTHSTITLPAQLHSPIPCTLSPSQLHPSHSPIPYTLSPPQLHPSHPPIPPAQLHPSHSPILHPPQKNTTTNSALDSLQTIKMELTLSVSQLMSPH